METERIDRFLRDTAAPTPCIVVDLDVVRARYRALQALLPEAAIIYAVKANPAPAVIAALAELGANFDLASAGEIDRCLGLGVPAARCSFGNTIKSAEDVGRAARAGLDLFAFDSAGELDKLARLAPGARVFCRLLVANTGSQWPLSRKFGCSHEMAVDLLLRPHGRAVCARSASRSMSARSRPIRTNGRWRSPAPAGVFRACAKAGLDARAAQCRGRAAGAIPLVHSAARRLCRDDRKRAAIRIRGSRAPPLIEPGRYMVGDAGLLRSTVLLIAIEVAAFERRWVYLDAGRYNGLPETIRRANPIPYPDAA